MMCVCDPEREQGRDKIWRRKNKERDRNGDRRREGEREKKVNGPRKRKGKAWVAVLGV